MLRLFRSFPMVTNIENGKVQEKENNSLGRKDFAIVLGKYNPPVPQLAPLPSAPPINTPMRSLPLPLYSPITRRSVNAHKVAPMLYLTNYPKLTPTKDHEFPAAYFDRGA